MQGGNTRSSPAFPEIEDQLGYNPARFLDQPQSVPDHICDTSPMATVQAFIRGMDEIATVRAWIEVEVALGRGPDGQPRQAVIKWLNQRQAQLDAATDAQSDAGGATPESPTDETHADAGDPEDNDETIASADTSTPAATDTDATVDTTSGDAVVAADGGTCDDPPCPDCQTALRREEIAGQIGFWCPQCEDVRNPAATEVPA